MSSCRSCGASIVWALTRTGKRIPLDPEADPAGNVLVRYDERTGLAHADIINSHSAAEASGRMRYHTHFMTCPQAAGWRQRDELPRPS